MADRELMEATLERDGVACLMTHVQAGREFEALLKGHLFDLIISDYSLPAYDGEEALAAAQKLQPETPFILLSGTIGEERAVKFLKSGATDCVLKQNLIRLGPAIRRAVAEASEKKERQKAETQLHAQAAELRALAARLQAIREEERIRIARELHDEMGEALMAQKFGLTWLRRRLEQEPVPKAEIIAKIGELCRLIDGSAIRVRELCADLRPSILDDLGLSAAIEWQAQEFQTRTGIVCEIAQGVDLLDLDEQHATTVFRIFQEILTNVARHAKANGVHVSLRVSGPALLLAVTDNGKGICEDKACGGTSLGLLGMRERAALLGGKIAISSAPGNGTTVTVTIPFVLKSAISKSRGSRNNHPICE